MGQSCKELDYSSCGAHQTSPYSLQSPWILTPQVALFNVSHLRLQVLLFNVPHLLLQVLLFNVPHLLLQVVLFNFGGQSADWQLKEEWLPPGDPHPCLNADRQLKLPYHASSCLQFPLRSLADSCLLHEMVLLFSFHSLVIVLLNFKKLDCCFNCAFDCITPGLSHQASNVTVDLIFSTLPWLW